MDPREGRLGAIREEARRHGVVDGAGITAAGGPLPGTATGYYGRPVLKAPVWTWEVPAYFALGGIAGMAAAIAAVAELAGGNPDLASDARVVALAGAALSPILLISDLGRPRRFLNMLRVFKPQSAMSVGAWTLVAFSAAVAASVLADVASPWPAMTWLPIACHVTAAGLGLVLATYAGVLLGVSAVPVWAENARILPIHFAGSSLGAAAGVLELAGHHVPALDVIGLGAAAIVLAGAMAVELNRRPANRPLQSGRPALLVRTGDVLAGPVVIVLRAVASGSVSLRLLAALAAIAGSVCLRYGWVAAGRASAADPAAVLDAARR